ncbi:hypothetical protein ACTHGU_21980 [Chitinophagaceae bacterium MMS25-I14]
MSLVAFQQLFAGMVADPVLCRKIKYDPSVLNTEYDLTEQERERISHIVQQKGMGINCMLYQINRFTPLFDLMPYSCKMMGKEVHAYTREFWDGYIKTNFQFRDEVLLFSEFLLSKMDRGEIGIPYLRDVVHFEITYNFIRFGLFHNPPGEVPVYMPCLAYDTRMVYMEHDIRFLIDLVLDNPVGTIFSEVPAAAQHYLIRYRDKIEMQRIDDELAGRIAANNVDVNDLPAEYRSFFR